MRTFLIILAVIAAAIGIFFLGIWQKWWKNPFAMPNGNGGNGGTPDNGGNGNGGTPDNGGNGNGGTPDNGGNGNGGTPPPGGEGEEMPPGSLLVTLGELSAAPNPNGVSGQLSASEMKQFFHKSTLNPKFIDPLIHYVAPSYPASPFIFWWYKNGHYTFIKTEAGIHYYRKSILPGEIKLLVQPADSCYPDWYLSGSKYVLKREESYAGLKRCVYEKQ